ncbi:hypothetical protein [Tissierella praeacuta]|uniref:hypothetical protein n=1 Tax=Tissierella praeacuta TaxID=43131 RepID=UPI0033406C0D
MKLCRINKKVVLVILIIGLIFLGKHIYDENIPPRPFFKYNDSLYVMLNPLEINIQDVEQLENIMTIKEEVKVYPKNNGQAYKIPKETNIYKSNKEINSLGINTLYCKLDEQWFYCLLSIKE